MIYDNTVVGILADTHAANEALLEQAHGAVQAFYDSKPKRPCVACGGPFTITVGDNGLREWRCDKCGRTETTLAELTAERQQKAINNTAPPPPAAPTKADARAKLTAAVARRGDAHQHERTIDAALDNARSARATAEDALDTAAANLKTAEFGAAEALAKAARAGKPPPVVSVASAREALQDATDTLEAASRAVDELFGQQRQAAQHAAFQDTQVLAAAVALLGATHGDILQRTKQAMQTFVACYSELSWLYEHHAIPGSDELRQLMALRRPDDSSEVRCPELDAELQDLIK